MGKQRRLKQKRRERRQKAKATVSAAGPDQTLGLSGASFNALMVLIAGILCFLIYVNSLNGPFLFDDRQILTNPYLRLTDLSLENIWNAGTTGPNSNRVVANISFALNYNLHQFESSGYRISNLVIHLVTGFFLYFFILATLRLHALRQEFPRYREIALFATLIWLAHPLGVQSVAYIVQRMNSLAALFFILAMLLYVKGRLCPGLKKKWALFSGTAVSALFALGSKENSAILPVIILLYEWYFFQGLSGTWLKRRLPVLLGVMAILFMIAIVFLGPDPFGSIVRGYSGRDFTLAERLLTESRVVIYYLTLIIFPHPSRLSLNYDYPVSHSLVDPVSTLISFILIAGMLGTAWVIARKYRMESFCLLWFFGNLVIESSIIPLEIIYEHRTYVPSMGILVLAVALIYRLANARWIPVLALTATVAVFSVWAHERSGVWSDELRLWSDIVDKQPTLARGHLGLGVTWKGRGEQYKAFESYKRAIEADPSYADAHNNIGVIYEERGLLDDALASYQKAYELDNRHFLAVNNIASIYTSRRDYAKALQTYEKSLAIHPRYADTYKGIALTYRAMNNREKFNENLAKARELEKPTTR